MSDYSDEYVRRSLRVNRVSAGEAVKSAGKLASAQSRISAALMRLSDAEFSGPARAKATKTISDILTKQYSEAAKDADKLAAEMVRLEADWQVSVIGEYTNSVVNLAPIEEAIQIARTTPYQGKTFQNWFRDAGVKAPRKAFQIIEAGFVNGKTIPEITKEINVLAGKAIPEIKTLVRSNLLHASSIGRAQVVKANSDLIEGKYWNSVLDVRTTADICGIRDQKKYDLGEQPIGHSLPWGAGPGQMHFNCRSISIPMLIGVDVKTKRPSIGSGKEYERGDSTTNRGTVRKPTKANREKGIFKIKPVSSRTNFEDFLGRQKKDFIADNLGSMDKAERFIGGEPLLSIINDPLGTPLQINQL